MDSRSVGVRSGEERIIFSTEWRQNRSSRSLYARNAGSLSCRAKRPGRGANHYHLVMTFRIHEDINCIPPPFLDQDSGCRLLWNTETFLQDFTSSHSWVSVTSFRHRSLQRTRAALVLLRYKSVISAVGCGTSTGYITTIKQYVLWEHDGQKLSWNYLCHSISERQATINLC
jgi:hypothetical protein